MNSTDDNTAHMEWMPDEIEGVDELKVRLLLYVLLLLPWEKFSSIYVKDMDGICKSYLDV